MGSNQISLSHSDDSSAKIIDLLKAHLEDTSPDSQIIKNGLRPLLPIKEETLDNVLEYLQELADFPPVSSLQDDHKSHSSNINQNDNDEEDSDSDDSHFSGSGSICNSNNLNDKNLLEHQMRTIKLEYQATHDGDHCYTRCKTRVDPAPLGVQTPSDSEEEIDVVSVGDKTLPTNPSARDRRALQTTVADKITARMVKTPRTNKNVTQRKHFSDEDSFTSSSDSSSPIKLSSSHSFTSVQCNDVTSSRKRSHPSKEPGTSSNGSNKRNRGKKQKSPGKRQSSDSDEADTIEKRNLHNDMERQRRIGLKNLFEELKCQIPNIKDKERAPKVSILREAASLCNKLNREQEQINYLKKQQARLLQRVKILRMSLAPKWG
jgi:Myc proto-oncogene protein